MITVTGLPVDLTLHNWTFRKLPMFAGKNLQMTKKSFTRWFNQKRLDACVKKIDFYLLKLMFIILNNINDCHEKYFFKSFLDRNHGWQKISIFFQIFFRLKSPYKTILSYQTMVRSLIDNLIVNFANKVEIIFSNSGVGPISIKHLIIHSYISSRKINLKGQIC